MMRAAHLPVVLWALVGGPAAMATCANMANCTCTVSTSGLVFGTYSPQSLGPTDSVATISTTCDSDDPGNSTFTVALSPGSSSNASQRHMVGSGSGELLYNLYTNATRSTVWGDDGGGGVTVVAPFPAASGSTQKLSIYGRIPARQSIAPGGYSDVITITIIY